MKLRFVIYFVMLGGLVMPAVCAAADIISIATSNFVEGAYRSLDDKKQNKIDTENKLPYNLLSGTPSIPTSSTVADWGFTKNTGTVTKVNDVAPTNGNVTINVSQIRDGASASAPLVDMWVE